jgi:phage-related holin
MIAKEPTISFTEYISSEWPWLVNFCKFCFYGVFVFLDINQYQSSILLGFMAIDTLFGVLKALTLGIPLKRNIFMVGFFTKLAVLVIPMLVALLGKGLGYDFKILVDVVMKLLILNEFISCITNILSIRTRTDIRNKDLITSLLHAIRGYGLRLFDTLITSIQKK